jgi:serine/threonine protein kinase
VVVGQAVLSHAGYAGEILSVGSRQTHIFQQRGTTQLGFHADVRSACTVIHLLQIIRGSFTPLPTTRSKELRELVTSMLQLDASRRPSANQLLAMPVLRARIQNFLTRSLQVRVMMALGCAYCGCRVSHTRTCTNMVVSKMHTQRCTYPVTTVKTYVHSPCSSSLSNESVLSPHNAGSTALAAPRV